MSQPIIQSMAKCPWVLLLAIRVACARRTRRINVTYCDAVLEQLSCASVKDARARAALTARLQVHIICVFVCIPVDILTS